MEANAEGQVVEMERALRAAESQKEEIYGNNIYGNNRGIYIEYVHRAQVWQHPY